MTPILAYSRTNREFCMTRDRQLRVRQARRLLAVSRS
jgi:hypothetical protein